MNEYPSLEDEEVRVYIVPTKEPLLIYIVLKELPEPLEHPDLGMLEHQKTSRSGLTRVMSRTFGENIRTSGLCTLLDNPPVATLFLDNKHALIRL
jgi:hypothetical protein